jgi:hypothetical protein
MSNLQIEDYHDFFNSIGLGDPPVQVDHSAKVTFDTRWQAITPVEHLDNTGQDFGGDFRRCRATIEWSAREPAQHFAFVSDGASTTYNLPNQDPVIGRERNGVFHP